MGTTLKILCNCCWRNTAAYRRPRSCAIAGTAHTDCIRTIFEITTGPVAGGNSLKHSGQLTCPEPENYSGQISSQGKAGAVVPATSNARRVARSYPHAGQ